MNHRPALVAARRGERRRRPLASCEAEWEAMAGSRESLPTPASSGAGDKHLAAHKQRRRRFYCRGGAAYGVGMAPAHGRDSEVSRMD